jgi:predicted P-loop ATPase
MPQLIVTAKGQPKACLENVYRLLRAQRRWRFSFNEMGGAVLIDGQPITDPVVTRITRWCQKRDVMVASMAVGEVIRELANETKIHPARDYLNGLRWDGKERLTTWFITHFGAENNIYTQAIGRAWLISAVARVIEPGCQVDHLPVFRGEQGIGKSSGLRALVPDPAWFIDDLRDIGGKDALLQFAGVLIAEVAELHAFKSVELAKLRSFITSPADSYRPPYARASARFPRSFVFAATANEDLVLKDPTGNRRFWPVDCEFVKVDDIKRDRDQLWAEAVVAYRRGDAWHLTDQKVVKFAEREQEEARIPDAYEAPIRKFLDDKEHITVEEIFDHLEQPRGGGLYGQKRALIARTKVEEMRIADCLRALGWRRKQIGKDRRRSWVPKGQKRTAPNVVNLRGGST